MSKHPSGTVDVSLFAIFKVKATESARPWVIDKPSSVSHADIEEPDTEPQETQSVDEAPQIKGWEESDAHIPVQGEPDEHQNDAHASTSEIPQSTSTVWDVCYSYVADNDSARASTKLRHLEGIIRFAESFSSSDTGVPSIHTQKQRFVWRYVDPHHIFLVAISLAPFKGSSRGVTSFSSVDVTDEDLFTWLARLHDTHVTLYGPLSNFDWSQKGIWDDLVRDNINSLFTMSPACVDTNGDHLHSPTYHLPLSLLQMPKNTEQLAFFVPSSFQTLIMQLADEIPFKRVMLLIDEHDTSPKLLALCVSQDSLSSASSASSLDDRHEESVSRVPIQPATVGLICSILDTLNSTPAPPQDPPSPTKSSYFSAFPSAMSTIGSTASRSVSHLGYGLSALSSYVPRVPSVSPAKETTSSAASLAQDPPMPGSSVQKPSVEDSSVRSHPAEEPRRVEPPHTEREMRVGENPHPTASHATLSNAPSQESSSNPYSAAIWGLVSAGMWGRNKASSQESAARTESPGHNREHAAVYQQAEDDERPASPPRVTPFDTHELHAAANETLDMRPKMDVMSNSFDSVRSPLSERNSAPLALQCWEWNAFLGPERVHIRARRGPLTLVTVEDLDEEHDEAEDRRIMHFFQDISSFEFGRTRSQLSHEIHRYPHSVQETAAQTQWDVNNEHLVYEAMRLFETQPSMAQELVIRTHVSDWVMASHRDMSSSYGVAARDANAPPQTLPEVMALLKDMSNNHDIP